MAKLNLNLTLVHLFMSINKNSLKTKFTQYFEQTYEQVHTKMQQDCGKNKFTLRETKL